MKENRKTFFARLQMALAPSEVNLVRLAYIVVKEVHRGQVREERGENGEPLRYFEHLRRATLIAIDDLKLHDVVVICELLLHDSVEDRDLEPHFIEQFFGRDIARGVLTVTKVEGETKAETAARVFASGDWRFMTAKLCDRLDNMRSLRDCSAEKRMRKIKETREYYMEGFHRLACELAPPVYRPAFVASVNELELLLRNLEETPDLVALEATPPE